MPTPDDLTRFDRRLMGCPCAVSLSSPSARDVAEAAMAEVERLERKFSRYLPANWMSLINGVASRGGAIDVDDETADIIDGAFDFHRRSGGLFDITSGPLRRVWNENTLVPPDRATLAPLLGKIGLEKVVWRRPRLAFTMKDMEIDLGGIVKEYAADRAARLCRSMGAPRGIVDLGGDLALFGGNLDGSPWRVGVADPEAPTRAAAFMLVDGCAGVATSGDYRRFWEFEGRRLSHVLDPRTGWPVEALTSVTVVADSCLEAGALSTIALLKGEEAPEWLARHAQAHVYIDRNRQLGGRAFRELLDDGAISISR